MSPLAHMDTTTSNPLAARVQALVDFYRHVQTGRMQGIPLLNPPLPVQPLPF